MSEALILASASEIRAKMLQQAGVDFSIQPARIDENAIKNALLADQARPRDIADTLAEAKARKIAGKSPDALVLGSDQVLAFGDQIISKPENPEQAIEHLQKLQGQKHQLFSAAVIYENAKPIWRHVAKADLYMRTLSDEWIKEYVARNWDSIKYSVGGYKIEEEGVRLFTRVDGNHYTVLGLPLFELLSYLILRGTLSS